MKNKILIKNGSVVFENEVLKRDILITKNKITRISPSLDGEMSGQVIDARNRFILPGGIDVHTHMELDAGNGLVSCDDYRNGSRAGLIGGITTFFGFAYPVPGMRLEQALQKEEQKTARSFSPCRLHTGIMEWQDDLEEQVKECIKRGNRSFKLHLNHPSVDPVFLLRVFRILFKYNGTAILHCEEGMIIDFLKQEFIRGGRTELSHYPRTREDYTEKMAVDTVINLAKQFETKIYIAHLTSRSALLSIEKAREESDIWIEAETCPQYLLFTEKVYKENDGYLNTCTPPYRHKIDSDSLWQGLRKGLIKVVSSDHCPFTRRQKEKGRDDFSKLAMGVPGIETLYPLMLSEGQKRKFKIQEIVKWVSTNPAKIFNLYPDKGVIRKNSIADLVIYNPCSSERISCQNLSTRLDYSPYEKRKLNGKIETVILNGRTVLLNNHFMLNP
ncbi:MAG: amidohydrolase family protein [bacterium]|nr:amidohydrolase family protein [bacterium]